MARSQSDGGAVNADESEGQLSATYDTGTLPTDGKDLSGREESAHTEHMVVVPVFDEWGEAYEEYEVTTESGSTYAVDPYGEGECPDMIFNSPSDGCKHIQRVVQRLNAGAVPAPGHDVEPYLTETVPQLVEEFAADLARLQEGRENADVTGDDQEAFEEAIGEVEHFIVTLADAYGEYRERVTDGECPPLREIVDVDASIAHLLGEEAEGDAK